MMTQTTTLDALLDAIVADLLAVFGDRCAQIGAYGPWDTLTDTEAEALVTPALLVELESFEIDDAFDAAGRCQVRCTLGIHCVLSQETARLQQALAQWAAEVARRVRYPADPDNNWDGNTWGLAGAVDAPQRITGQPGEFSPGLHGRDGWVVRWEQVVYLEGVSVC